MELINAILISLALISFAFPLYRFFKIIRDSFKKDKSEWGLSSVKYADITKVDRDFIKSKPITHCSNHDQ